MRWSWSMASARSASRAHSMVGRVVGGEVGDRRAPRARPRPRRPSSAWRWTVVGPPASVASGGDRCRAGADQGVHRGQGPPRRRPRRRRSGPTWPGELAATVLAAAAPLPVAGRVRRRRGRRLRPRARGGRRVRQREPGLNAAVVRGRRRACRARVRAGGRGPRRHPPRRRPRALAHVGGDDGRVDVVVLVPDRHVDGTNVLVVPTAPGFRFAYGPGSFAAHQAEADRLGSQCRRRPRRRPGLGRRHRPTDLATAPRSDPAAERRLTGSAARGA